jgi:hypothetical protein
VALPAPSPLELAVVATAFLHDVGDVVSRSGCLAGNLTLGVVGAVAGASLIAVPSLRSVQVVPGGGGAVSWRFAVDVLVQATDEGACGIVVLPAVACLQPVLRQATACTAFARTIAALRDAPTTTSASTERVGTLAPCVATISDLLVSESSACGAAQVCALPRALDESLVTPAPPPPTPFPLIPVVAGVGGAVGAIALVALVLWLRRRVAFGGDNRRSLDLSDNDGPGRRSRAFTLTGLIENEAAALGAERAYIEESTEELLSFGNGAARAAAAPASPTSTAPGVASRLFAMLGMTMPAAATATPAAPARHDETQRRDDDEHDDEYLPPVVRPTSAPQPGAQPGDDDADYDVVDIDEYFADVAPAQRARALSRVEIMKTI